MSEVRFIRRNGRVIPIKVDKKKEAYKSAGFTAAGIGTSVASGKLFSKTLSKAKKQKQLAFGFIDDMGGNIPRPLRDESVSKLFKRAPQFKLGGQLLGGALLSQGVQRALKAAGVESDSVAIDIGAEAGSQLASGLITRSANKSFGMRSNFELPKSVKRIGKDVLSRLVKRQLRFKF